MAKPAGPEAGRVAVLHVDEQVLAGVQGVEDGLFVTSGAVLVDLGARPHRFGDKRRIVELRRAVGEGRVVNIEAAQQHILQVGCG